MWNWIWEKSCLVLNANILKRFISFDQKQEKSLDRIVKYTRYIFVYKTNPKFYTFINRKQQHTKELGSSAR